MPSREERLHQVTAKIDRARKHISDLRSEVRAFLDRRPYAVASRPHAKPGHIVYYVSRVEPIPDVLGLIAGDAIQNLMSALDHLAYQLVCSDTNDCPPNRFGIYFPIRFKAADYEKAKLKKMEGASAETLKAVDSVKPYKEGNSLLCALWQLNNIEKHRLLLTVGSQAAGIKLGPLLANLYRGKVAERGEIAETLAKAVEGVDAYVREGGLKFPLEAGYELLITDAKPGVPNQFIFEVALNETGVIEAKPIVEMLEESAGLVARIVDTLSHRLADTQVATATAPTSSS
jgi:hypothetical protein